MNLWIVEAQDGVADVRVAPQVIVESTESRGVIAYGATLGLGDAAMGGVREAIEAAGRAGARAVFSGGGGGTARAWMGSARREFEAQCDMIVESLRGVSLEWWFVPSVGDVLSDIPSTLAFMRGRQGQPLRILLDPGALLTESMLGHWEDHVGRASDAIGGHESCRGVVLHGVGERSGEDPESRLALTTLAAGRLDAETFVRRASAGLMAKGIVIENGDLARVQLILSTASGSATLGS